MISPTELTPRLTECFRVVFPDLSDAQIAAATQENVASWDSVASITLVNVIEDELGVTMDLERIAEFNSFAAIRQHLST
jgi:acyl carrier protein